MTPVNIFNSAQMLINGNGELLSISSVADTITACSHTCCLSQWVTRLELLVLHIPTQRLGFTHTLFTQYN